MKITLLPFLMFSAGIYGQAKFTLSGKVSDCRSQKPIANVDMKLIGSDGSMIRVTTNDSGCYFFNSQKLNPKRQYILATQASNDSHVAGSVQTIQRGYLNSSEKAKFDTNDSIGRNFVFDFCLMKNIGCIMRSPMLFFESNSVTKYVCDSTSMDLSFFRDFMEDNPNYVVEISGHAMYKEKKTQMLAQKRADFIRDELIKKGIEQGRLIAIGHSDTKLYQYFDEETYETKLADKEDPKNGRVYITIIRKDYISPNVKKASNPTLLENEE